MRPSRRRWTLRWLVPALAAVTIAAPAGAYPITEERLSGGHHAPSAEPSLVALHPEEFLQSEPNHGFAWLEAALLTSGIGVLAGGAGARLIVRRRPSSLPAG